MYVLCFLSYLCITSGEGTMVETGVVSKQALFYVATITWWDTQTKNNTELYNIPLMSLM